MAAIPNSIGPIGEGLFSSVPFAVLEVVIWLVVGRIVIVWPVAGSVGLKVVTLSVVELFELAGVGFGVLTASVGENVLVVVSCVVGTPVVKKLRNG